MEREAEIKARVSAEFAHAYALCERGLRLCDECDEIINKMQITEIKGFWRWIFDGLCGRGWEVTR